MAGIVIELEKEAMNGSGSLQDLLRKALVVARKLKLKDFESWLNKEMKGYSIDDEVPGYRKFPGEIKAWNPYHGWIAVSTSRGAITIHIPSREPISSLINVYENSKNNCAVIQISGDLAKRLNSNSDFPIPTNYQAEIPINAIYAAIDAVRNIVLDWALVLEENGIKGEGIEFTNEEKKTALESSTINQYTMNFYGNVDNTQIQQDTTDSRQSIRR